MIYHSKMDNYIIPAPDESGAGCYIFFTAYHTFMKECVEFFKNIMIITYDLDCEVSFSDYIYDILFVMKLYDTYAHIGIDYICNKKCNMEEFNMYKLIYAIDRFENLTKFIGSNFNVSFKNILKSSLYILNELIEIANKIEEYNKKFENNSKHYNNDNDFDFGGCIEFIQDGDDYVGYRG